MQIFLTPARQRVLRVERCHRVGWQQEGPGCGACRSNSSREVQHFPGAASQRYHRGGGGQWQLRLQADGEVINGGMESLKIEHHMVIQYTLRSTDTHRLKLTMAMGQMTK